MGFFRCVSEGCPRSGPAGQPYSILYLARRRCQSSGPRSSNAAATPMPTPWYARSPRPALLVASAAAGLFAVVHRHVLGIARRPSWPPRPDAVTPDGAQAATEAFACARGARPRDAALEFAWSTAATLEPWVDGERFFPRIFADVEAARSSVHILMFGWREGEVGMRMAALLERKLSEGVEVRVIVDAFGSRPYEQARGMFTRLAAAGAEIVVNDVLPPDRAGLFPAGRPAGAWTSSAAPTTASCTSSTGASSGRAAPASRITSTTAASTT